MLIIKNKVYFLSFICLAIILIFLAAFFLLAKNKTVKFVDLNNPEYLFHINIPSNFNQDQKDRLQLKIDETRKAYNEKKDDNWTWVMIGNMYLYAEDYERAVLAFNKASEIQPDDVTAMLNLANIYEDYLIDYQEAEKYYSKAIAIFPNQANLYDQLAKLYWLKMNRPEDAETIYLQGLGQVTDQVAILLDLIDFYGRTNQLDQQKIYAKKLLEAYPDNAVYKKDFGNLIK